MYLCPTPIGHLRDITLRTLDVLREVHAIACEDTRVTRKLLAHYEIHKPLISYHSHNRQRSTGKIRSLLQEGNDLALVTDAGTPGIQDPGQELAAILEEAGVAVEVLPGPSALIPAIVLSGFGNRGFVFLGFLPKKRKERLSLLERYVPGPLPIVLYESPLRVVDTLRDLAVCYGKDREIFFCRELSKFYEERIRGHIEHVIDVLSEREGVKGEIVLVVRGQEIEPEHTLSPAEQAFLIRLLELGISRKEAVHLFNSIHPARKNTVKQFLHSPLSVDFARENCFNKNRSGR